MAWAYRYTIFEDGVSYLDIATDASSRSLMALATNAYWSPLYPGVLSGVFALTRPSLEQELPLTHLIDWLVFVLAALAFSLMLTLILNYTAFRYPSSSPAGYRAHWTLLAFGFSVFLAFNSTWTLWFVSPDVLLEVFIFLSAAVCIRCYMPGAGRRHYCLLDYCWDSVT